MSNTLGLLLKNGAPDTAQTHTQHCNTLYPLLDLERTEVEVSLLHDRSIEKKQSSHRTLRPHSSMVLRPLTALNMQKCSLTHCAPVYWHVLYRHDHPHTCVSCGQQVLDGGHELTAHGEEN